MKSNLKHFIPFLSVQDRTLTRIGLFSITIPVVFGAMAVWFSYSKVSFSEGRYNAVFNKLNKARTELKALQFALDSSQISIQSSSAQLESTQQAFLASTERYTASHAEHERRISKLSASYQLAESNYSSLKSRNAQQESLLSSSQERILLAQQQLNKLNDSLQMLRARLSQSHDTLLRVRNDAELMRATLDAMQVQAARIKPQVRTRTMFGDRDKAGHQLFEFTLWLDVPKDLRAQIKDVTYKYTASGSSEPTKQLVAERGRRSEFPMVYEDFGCSSEVQIDLRFINNLTVSMKMDECQELANPSIEPLQSAAH